jgi:hypothetical protein
LHSADGEEAEAFDPEMYYGDEFPPEHFFEGLDPLFYGEMLEGEEMHQFDEEGFIPEEDEGNHIHEEIEGEFHTHEEPSNEGEVHEASDEKALG